jgi:hypothetical protein
MAGENLKLFSRGLTEESTTCPISSVEVNWPTCYTMAPNQLNSRPQSPIKDEVAVSIVVVVLRKTSSLTLGDGRDVRLLVYRYRVRIPVCLSEDACRAKP